MLTNWTANVVSQFFLYRTWTAIHHAVEDEVGDQVESISQIAS